MTIEEKLMKPISTSRTWRKGDKYIKFRWMHQRYPKDVLELTLPFRGRRYR